jgi:hypothetical protein
MGTPVRGPWRSLAGMEEVFSPVENGTDSESSDESDSSEGELETLKWDHDPMWF